MPEMVLISVVLPAPLSPTMAVTCPGGMSRSMSASARTGPKFLPTPRSLSNGPAWPGSSRPATVGRPGLVGAGLAASVVADARPAGSVTWPGFVVSAVAVWAAGDGARPAAAGRAPSAPLGVVTGNLRRGGGKWSSHRDSVRLAGRRVGSDAQLLRWNE